MSGFTSLATAVSGLNAARRGLGVTGHNMSNSQVQGFSRQRVIQKDFGYQTVGTTAYGTLKKGLGTDWNAIEQIRNGFLDITYRKYAGKLSYYSVKATTGTEIESMLGEMQGSYNFQSVINDMWDSLQELSMHPDGIETRDQFLATCKSFITKANDVYQGLFDYQHRLDEQVRDQISEINTLVSDIDELNQMIRSSEAAGDNANDYRDARNLKLDRLSEIIHIETREDEYGVVNITAEGHQLLVQGSQKFLGLKQMSGSYSFVEPVFTDSKTVLPADTPPSDFEPLFNYSGAYNADRDNDYGSLKALMATRGAMPAYYPGADALWEPMPPSAVLTPPNAADSVQYPLGVNDPAYLTDMRQYDIDLANMKLIYPDYQVGAAGVAPAAPTPDDLRAYEAAQYNYKSQTWSMEYAMVPRTMIKLDAIVNKIVSMVNDAVAPHLNGFKDPNAPYDLTGSQSYVEVFKRTHMDRWTSSANNAAYNAEIPGDYYSLYSIGNLVVNPILQDTEGGYNYLALSDSGDREDNSLILEKLLDTWADPNSDYAVDIDGIHYGIQDAYQKFVTSLGLETEESLNYVNAQTIQVNEAENKRTSIMGVSMDEELNNMMKYQYAYQAAARILNVVDSMIDRVINQTGRVGL